VPVRRPWQIARGERDIGLRDLATGLGEAFTGAEAARGAAQELARPLVVAELRHRNAPQSKRRRVVAQRHALERTERITRENILQATEDVNLADFIATMRAR